MLVGLQLKQYGLKRPKPQFSLASNPTDYLNVQKRSDVIKISKWNI